MSELTQTATVEEIQQRSISDIQSVIENIAFVANWTTNNFCANNGIETRDWDDESVRMDAILKVGQVCDAVADGASADVNERFIDTVIETESDEDDSVIGTIPVTGLPTDLLLFNVVADTLVRKYQVVVTPN